MTGQGAPSCDSQHWRPHSSPIHILGDNLFLKIFNLCRPTLSDQDEAQNERITQWGKWDRERWWYSLAQVCRKWRYLVLDSASHLGLCLVCTYGIPVEAKLAHSPHLPLVIDYGNEDREVTTQDEEGILLALRRRKRVRRIRLWMPASILRKLVVTLGGEFPELEYLYIKPLATDSDEGLILPETFRAPHLRHFALRNVTYNYSMVHLPHPTPRVQSAEGVSQCVQCSGSQLWRSLRMFIHILDDDSLLNIFYLSRPVLLDNDEGDPDLILLGGKWDRERWWYTFAQVCRRWRHLILASASYLGLSLLCKYDTPVADMLAHSPPLPLIIDHVDKDRDITAKDEEGILIALQHRDRLSRVRLLMPVLNLERLIASMNGEFPMLEYLYIAPMSKHNTHLVLPQTFLAPHLRHLVLVNLAFPITSLLLLPMATNLVTLSLQNIHPSAYFRPNDLLQRLSLMPQLETLGIVFHSPVPNHDVEMQLFHTPIATQVTLPNLRWFAFGGASAYLEALLPRLAVPLLEKLQIIFFFQLSFSIPHLLQLMTATPNFRFASARFKFYKNLVEVTMYPYEGATVDAFFMEVRCTPLDWQVASAAQFSHVLGTVFSAVEYLSLQFLRYPMSSENNEADRAQWRELLRSFNNVKTLRIGSGEPFVMQLSRSLQSGDGESPMDLLPELKELEYPASGVYRDFDAFVDARRNVGHPVTVVRR